MNDTTITCKAPPHAGGSIAVAVGNANGVAALPGAFLYLLPTLSDLNGDGDADLVVGAPRDDSLLTDVGAVHVFFGPLAGGAPLTSSDADVVLAGEALSLEDLFGAGLALGDVNGDQVLDLLVGAPGNDSSAPDAGAVYVFFGGPGSSVSWRSAPTARSSGSAAATAWAAAWRPVI